VYDGADNLLMRFEYADGRMPIAMTKGGVRYYLAFDQVGTLRLVTDSTGAVVKRIDYDSFGNVVADTNPAFAVPFGFAGGLHDRDTGLVRFGYRDYDPETGRWTAKDPILFAGGDTDLYGYCLDDAVNFIDPDGLDAIVSLYPGAGGFGHVGIGVNTKSTTGFYPGSNASTFLVMTGQPVPGEMRPDTTNPKGTLIIPTTPAQDQAIQNFIKQRTQNPGNYDLNNRNCATTVRDALSAGGIDTEETILPRALFKNLQQQFGGKP
jgi:RHS repeat-associated protein